MLFISCFLLSLFLYFILYLFFFFFFLMIRRPPRSTLFPTRRSSDLMLRSGEELFPGIVGYENTVIPEINLALIAAHDLDRKSTRLNSSHITISYAVFCLKKKKKRKYK